MTLALAELDLDNFSFSGLSRFVVALATPLMVGGCIFDPAPIVESAGSESTASSAGTQGSESTRGAPPPDTGADETVGGQDCGNGLIEAGEDCDPNGPNLAGSSCMSIGFGAGTLACSEGCTFDLAGCFSCGDGTKSDAEDCDGDDFGDAQCTDFPSGIQDNMFTGGTLSCDVSCQIETTDCTYSCERSGCALACDPMTQECVECIGDGDCGAAGPEPYCIEQACVSCEVAGCGPEDPVCGPSGVCVAAPRTVFLTSGRYSAALGGLAGADTTCNLLAANAGLGGTYMAWLSDNNQSVSDRFDHSTGSYQLVDGTTIANNWDQLVSGSLLAPINVTQLGVTVEVMTMQPFCDDAELVWTGTFASGNPSMQALCADWNATMGGGSMIGSMQSTESNWSFDCTSTNCNGPAYLYCFEQ